MSGNTIVTNAPYPPTTTQISESLTGTVTNIACAGPCKATVYSAAGTPLLSVNTPGGINQALNLSFLGGPAYITQQTPSSITVTY